jgi:hypothetical protein
LILPSFWRLTGHTTVEYHPESVTIVTLHRQEKAMSKPGTNWIFLFYSLPAQPTRLRLHIWRRLQKMGALYLHNAAWVLPARPELVENMEYAATTIVELGGTCQLITGAPRLPDGEEQIIAEFRALADGRLEEICRHLSTIAEKLEGTASLTALEQVDEELKRERTAYLRSRKRAYFGSTKGTEVESLLEQLRLQLDSLYPTK